MILALDTETTGIDLRHGARPFFVTTCDQDGDQRWWEWDVDPLTREVDASQHDLDDIWDLVQSADELVLHNTKFDVAALNTLDRRFGDEWPWHKTHDTLIAGHLLASNRPHDLTSMTVQYVGMDIQRYEDALERAVKEARAWAKANRPDWALARADRPDMPSAGEKTWRYDYWLPRAVAQEDGRSLGSEPRVKMEWRTSTVIALCKLFRDTSVLPIIGDALDDAGCDDAELLAAARAGDPWVMLQFGDPEPPDVMWTALRDYSNADSAATIMLHRVVQAEIDRRGLRNLYDARMRVLPVAYKMESRGLTISRTRTEELTRKYTEESSQAVATLQGIAGRRGHDLVLPRGASPNNNLREFIFDNLRLPKQYDKKGKSGEPTLNKAAMSFYLQTLPQDGEEYQFIRTLMGKRSRDTALAYMEGYRRFWRPARHPGWYRLHPNLNPTGTDTLRWSSNNPNEQNISKKEDFNLRYCFGPAPGREWWSFDAKNIELRIPAYESGQEEFIELFERPDDPPYFGSNHLLIAHLLFPREFEECLRNGESFKDKYKATLYQRVKNGNFAVQYGAVDRADGRGTADLTYGIPGAQARIKTRFKKQDQLNQSCISMANRLGYVETMPDKDVDPNRGYPLLCTRSEYGDVLPTVPLNYHVQGTAMWWMMMAMIRVQGFFDRLNRGELFAGQEWPGGYYLVLQVHDELVPDMPRRGGKTYNLPIAREVKRLMEAGGDGIGVPTPVSMEYHAVSWDHGEIV